MNIVPAQELVHHTIHMTPTFTNWAVTQWLTDFNNHENGLDNIIHYLGPRGPLQTAGIVWPNEGHSIASLILGFSDLQLETIHDTQYITYYSYILFSFLT